MKANATACNSTPAPSTGRQSGATFTKVLDGRKQVIRGLWERNGRYYARLMVEDAITGNKTQRRVPLLDKDGAAVRSVSEAREAMERLKIQRTDSTLPVLGRTPLFSAFVDTYLEHVRAGTENSDKA